MKAADIIRLAKITALYHGSACYGADPDLVPMAVDDGELRYASKEDLERIITEAGRQVDRIAKFLGVDDQ